LIEGIDVTKEPLRSKDFVSFVSENVMLYGSFSATRTWIISPSWPASAA